MTTPSVLDLINTTALTALPLYNCSGEFTGLYNHHRDNLSLIDSNYVAASGLRGDGDYGLSGMNGGGTVGAGCNNTDIFEDSMDLEITSFFRQLFKIMCALICAVGIVGNSLVIYVVLRFSKMQTVTNMYIFNLAVADEMFLIGLPFLITTISYDGWPFGQRLCRMYMTTTSINQFTSSLLLTVMSADRYVAVCHPISSPRYRTPFIAKFICLTVWTVSALLMVPIFMYAKLNRKEPDTLVFPQNVSCVIMFPENEIMNGMRAFTLYSFTLGFFIPFILIFLFYFLVIRKLRTVGPKNKSKEKKRSHKKVTILVLTVITVYVFCWLPHWISQAFIIFQPRYHRGSTFSFVTYVLTGCLSYVNSAVNPILYAFLSENFKKSFAKAFTCATSKDVNTQLHVENSVFPKSNVAGGGRGSSRIGGGGASVASCVKTKETALNGDTMCQLQAPVVASAVITNPATVKITGDNNGNGESGNVNSGYREQFFGEQYEDGPILSIDRIKNPQTGHQFEIVDHPI